MFILMFQWLLSPILFCLSAQDYHNYDYNKDLMAPVILVPGVIGSQVQGKWNATSNPKGCDDSSSSWKQLWFRVDILAGGDSLKCWVYRYKLIYNRATHRSHNEIGVEVRIPGQFGSLAPVEHLTRDPITQLGSGYLQTITNSLRASGYDPAINLKAAPYDGRFAPPQQAELGYYAKLSKLVERVAVASKRKVAIVSHSYGGNMAAYFLTHKTQAWKDRHIHAFIPLSTPWLGSPKPVEMFITGTNFKIPTLEKSEIKELFKTWQSMALLLPAEEAYKVTVLVEWVDKNKTYTAKDYKQLFHDIHYMDGYLMRQDVRSLMSVHGNKLGVKVVCIWSNGVKTPFKMIIHGDNITNPTSVKFKNVDGDGTVSLGSLQYCKRFPGVTVYEVPGPDHIQIVHEEEVINYVKLALVHAKPFE